MAVVPPLSTQGAKIVDSRGNQVLLRGVNWFGLETELHCPCGLWARGYKDLIGQIRDLGFNIIRLPYSVNALKSSNVSSINFSLGSNGDLIGKTPLEIMDLVIQEAERKGLMILLDSHRLNDSRIPEVWYGDGFTEEDWINTWKMLAQRYRNQRNVIGADLKNEPHGKANWGNGDLSTDWRLAAERCGNAIHSVDPDWLIIVEGVEGNANIPGQKFPVHWWGGNLEGVRNFPVRLNKGNKVVYSPHEYGPDAYNQSWFDEPTFPNNLYDRWEFGFYYIARQNIAPVLIGEFGGRFTDRNSKAGIWHNQLVDYIQGKDLSYTYWCLNPNSSDTGGILLDDWTSVDRGKHEMLKRSLGRVQFLN